MVVADEKPCLTQFFKLQIYNFFGYPALIFQPYIGFNDS